MKPLGVSGKGTHLVARCENSDSFLGGAFAVANHVADFAPSTTLLTAVGEDQKSLNLDMNLHADIKKELLFLNETQTKRGVAMRALYPLSGGRHRIL